MIGWFTHHSNEKKRYLVLVVLRLFVGVFWLSQGLHKLMDADFALKLSSYLETWSRASSLWFYPEILKEMIAPNTWLVAPVLSSLEVLLGVSWLTGIGMKVLSSLAIFLIVAYGLATCSQGGQYLEFNALFLGLTLLLLFANADETFGLAGRLPRLDSLMKPFRNSAADKAVALSKKTMTPKKASERDKQKLLKETTLTDVKAATSAIKKSRLSLVKNK
jgi:uncharacterized membrane protein YphA (DoxX/SURF4 family)